MHWIQNDLTTLFADRYSTSVQSDDAIDIDDIINDAVDYAYRQTSLDELDLSDLEDREDYLEELTDEIIDLIATGLEMAAERPENFGAAFLAPCIFPAEAMVFFDAHFHEVNDLSEELRPSGTILEQIYYCNSVWLERKMQSDLIDLAEEIKYSGEFGEQVQQFLDVVI